MNDSLIKYIIGIDPGKKTGFAVFDRVRKEIVRACTLDFLKIYVSFRSNEYALHDCVVNIEVPNNNFNWHKNKYGEKEEGASVGVGGVCRESTLLADLIEELGYKVNRIHPRGKLDYHQVRKITGYTGRTNPHVRDAIMLCWEKERK